MSNLAWLDRSEYPFPSRRLNLNGVRMHYVDEGQGEPVLMVHGNPTWSFLYRHLIQQLSPSFRCVAMDHVGFGLSDKPPDWSYKPEDHARNLAALIEVLGLEDITLVVQDWGGPIGISYAIHHPENVRRVVVLNTWLWPVDDDWYYVAFSRFTGGVLGRYLIRRFNFFARVIMPLAFGDQTRLTGDVHLHYLRPLARPEERKGCWTLPGEILRSSEWLRNLWARRSRLEDMQKLIVWGMKDIAFREKELNTWSSTFPDARVVRLPDVGHYVQEEAKEDLGQIVGAFLSG